MTGNVINHKHETALITGASRGIGAAIATQLAKSGFKKIALQCTENGKAKAEELAALLKGNHGVETIVLTADFSSDDGGIIEKVHSAFGSLDLLINNAGILGKTSFTEATLEEIEHVFRINYAVPQVLCGKAFKLWKAKVTEKLLILAP